MEKFIVGVLMKCRCDFCNGLFEKFILDIV